MSDKVRMTYQVGDGEPEASECDGVIVIPVSREGYSGLQVGTIVQGLSYEEVCRAFVTANVLVWHEFVEAAKPQEATLTRYTNFCDEFWPSYKYRCSSCGSEFFGGVAFDRCEENETFKCCPCCGTPITETIDKE